MMVRYPKLRNIVHTIYLPLNVFIASKGSNHYIFYMVDWTINTDVAWIHVKLCEFVNV